MKRFKLFKWATGKPPSGEVKEDASGGLYTGMVGVSAKNRMGHVGDMRYVAHRGGSGMVNGLMRVAYEDVYAATAEAMKWGALGKVDYGDDAVGMVVKMEPQCFEGFAVALEEVCRSPFSFESQLNPPLFVADIGGGRAKSSSGARRRQSAKEHWEHDAEAEALTAEQPWLKEGGEMPADVHVDRSPSYLRVDAGHQTKRMHHINKQRQEEATKNRVIDMWVPAGGSAQRVYPDIHSKDEDGNTALILAARNGWSEAVDVLLNMGASTRAKNNRGLTALAAAKLESSSASLAVFSGASGAAGRKRRAAQCCLLLDNRSILKTCQDGDLRRARYLLAEKGENVNSTNKYGMTPLHFAIMAKDVELTQLLVAFGANTHAVNNNGQSPVSLISGIADEKLAGELQDALGAGEAAAKQRRRDIQRRAAQLEAIAKEEDLLAREMRTYTKGTAAAAAVFKSFQKRHKGAKAAYRADTKEAEAAWPLPDPDKVKRPPGKYRLSGDAKRAMDWDPTVPRNALSLTSAWNRHALSLFHKQMKSKASREYKAKVTAAKAATELHRTQTTMAGGKAAREALRASKIPPYWAGSEEARHQAIIAGKTYTGAASTSSLVPAGGVGEMGGAQAEFIARSANPG
ncbi:ANKRD6 [Symbiodinium sp. KB8]|nr:ANKRD6 [Symbiodinium sp. KB8]